MSIRRSAIVVALLVLLALQGCATSPRNAATAGDMAVYGNWCGPGHPRAGTNPPAIDEVDAACRKHDFCYAEKKYFACECDNRLLADLATIKERKWAGRKVVDGDEYFAFENATTRIIRSYFAVTACSPSQVSDLIEAYALRGVTTVDVGTDTVARGAATVIDKAYFVIRLPFLLLVKGLCAIHYVPSCINADIQLREGRGVNTVVERRPVPR